MLPLNKIRFFGTAIVILTLFGSLNLIGQDKAKSDKIKHSGYGFSKVVNLTYEKAIERVTEELKKEGFGILTEADVKATLKKKLDVDVRPYKILGACNPPNAYQALQAEEEIGLLLPCNVIVYVNEKNETVVATIDPVASMQKVKNKKLAGVAKTIQAKLKNVLNNL